MALSAQLVQISLVFAVSFSNGSDHICVTGPLELSLAAVLHFGSLGLLCTPGVSSWSADVHYSSCMDVKFGH